MDTISVRLDPETTARLDRVAEFLAEQARGARITRSNALRVALDRGIAAFEAEMKSKRKR